MKKLKIILIFAFLLFIFMGCKDVPTLVSIETDSTSISESFLIEDFDLNKIKIILNKSDGTKESIFLSEEMLSSSDLVLLQSVGKHNITVRYKGLETKITIKLETDEVKVKLLQIYQKLVNLNSYQESYEYWISSLNIAPGLKIVDAIINEERRIIITLSDDSQVDGGLIQNLNQDGVYVFTINDTHGAFVSDDTPGMDKVGSVIKSLEDDFGEHIKIANGDIFQGSYISRMTYGLALIDALNLMEFDALVLGNHEFDWGLDKIEQYADKNLANGEADFPFLAANIVYKESGERLPWTEDYVILENNGYKVGVIGVIGHNLESSISYDMVKDYEFLQPYTIVQKHSKTLREELDCNLVLVATHNYDEGEINNYLSLPYESRIDGIITGHTHQKISRSIPHNNDYNLPIIQCDDKNETVGQIIINMDKNGNPVDSSIEHYLPEKYLSDQDFTVLINKYSDEINEGNRVIGYTTEMLYWDRLGKEMTNAMMERYAGDVAFINTGGVRATISTGNIRICDVFEVFPFDNIIVITSIRGDKLLSLYQEQKKYLYFNSSFDPADINSYSYYDIVTIDYVYTGSYYQKYFQNSSRVDRELMRDVFIEYLEEFYGN